MPIHTRNPLENITLSLLKYSANLGLPHIYRAIGSRIEQKENGEQGWNRPMLGIVYGVIRDTINGHTHSKTRGAKLMKQALASLFVVMDDDDVYWDFGLSIMRDFIQAVDEKKIVIPDNWRNHLNPGTREWEEEKYKRRYKDMVV